MVRESSNRSLHQITQKLHSRIEHLEQLYIVLSGIYGISLKGRDVKNEMVLLTKEISALFEELDSYPGGKKELEEYKQRYNQMARQWENFIKNGESKNIRVRDKVKRIFRKYRR